MTVQQKIEAFLRMEHGQYSDDQEMMVVAGAGMLPPFLWIFVPVTPPKTAPKGAFHRER